MSPDETWMNLGRVWSRRVVASPVFSQLFTGGFVFLVAEDSRCASPWIHGNDNDRQSIGMGIFDDFGWGFGWFWAFGSLTLWRFTAFSRPAFSQLVKESIPLLPAGMGPLAG